MAVKLVVEPQQPEIGHALGIEDAIEMVAFVLHHAGMETLGLTDDRLAVQSQPGIADTGKARHDTAHPRHRKAALPTERGFFRQRLDHRIEEDVERPRIIVVRLCPVRRRVVGFPGTICVFCILRVLRIRGFGRLVEDDDAQRHMNLGRGQAHPARVHHCFHHIADQGPDWRLGGVWDLLGRRAQHRITHFRNLENGHGRNMKPATAPVKGAGAENHPFLLFYALLTGVLRPCGKLAVRFP
jgi:hypothetical protein